MKIRISIKKKILDKQLPSVVENFMKRCPQLSLHRQMLIKFGSEKFGHE
jgi:hypothetical protein